MTSRHLAAVCCLFAAALLAIFRPNRAADRQSAQAAGASASAAKASAPGGHSPAQSSRPSKGAQRPEPPRLSAQETRELLERPLPGSVEIEDLSLTEAAAQWNGWLQRSGVDSRDLRVEVGKSLAELPQYRLKEGSGTGSLGDALRSTFTSSKVSFRIRPGVVELIDLSKDDPELYATLSYEPEEEDPENESPQKAGRPTADERE